MTRPPDSDRSELGELGVPSLLQTYKQQTQHLIEELDDCWSDLRRSKQTITKLVSMNDKLLKQLAVLKVEHEKVRWELSAINLKSGLDAGRRLVPGSNVHAGYGGKG